MAEQAVSNAVNGALGAKPKERPKSSRILSSGC
jgi:hypothetical protein